jgi:cytochrome c biogenesis protein
MDMSSGKQSGVKRFFAALRSLKLTIILVIYLVMASAVSTLIPQGENEAHYRLRYPSALAELVLAAGMDHFFSAPLFLAPSFCFFVNLSACTIFRFRRELRKKTRRNFGPDILHGGLILFIIAALMSVFNRMEGSIMLFKGQTALLPNGNTLVLDDLEYQHYENGRPKAWISYLTVLHEGRSLFASYPLEVNHPLRLRGFSLYQNSYGVMGGNEYTLIRAVRDPGYALVLASFVIAGAGTFITFFYKLRKQKL